MLLAETSQSSFGTSISSPTQLHLQQCSTQIQLPPSSAGYPTLSQNLNQNLAYPDAKSLFRRQSPKLPYYSSMPNPNNLPAGLASNQLIGSINPLAATSAGLPATAGLAPSGRFALTNGRPPPFRKSQSQPSRSLSPGSLRSYSPLLLDPLNPAANQYTLNRMYNRNELPATLASRTNSPLKRQLPQTPGLPTANLSGMNLNANMNAAAATAYSLSHPASFDSAYPPEAAMMEPMGAYGPAAGRFGAAATAAGHSSAMSNYEINRYKQYSKSSTFLPFNRSLDGVRSPHGMYSDSELNRQYRAYGGAYYRTPPQYPLSQPYGQQPPLFYHQYHRDGDYTRVMSKQEIEEEMSRHQHRHAKSKQKQQTYFSDGRDAREEQKYLKEQHPAKQQSYQAHHPQASQQVDEFAEPGDELADRRRRSLRKSSLDEAGEPYDKSYDKTYDKSYDKTYDASDRLQPGEGESRRKLSAGHYAGDEPIGSRITSVDQLNDAMIDSGVLSKEDVLAEQMNATRNGETGKHRSRPRNKAYSGVINESGEESESSSVSKSITSTISESKKGASRTVG